MHDRSVVVARPQGAAQLVLLFHGVGSSAENLVPLGEAIAQSRSDAMVVSVDAPHPSTFGKGREWFSVAGVTEQNRPDRIVQAMPSFGDAVQGWQRSSELGPDRTVLVGFSQGAIMALESTQLEGSAPASRVIALAGRFAVPARRAPTSAQFHFIHGEADPVIPAAFSLQAAQALRSKGGTATVDVLDRLGHAIDARVVRLLLAYLAERQG